MDAAQTVKLACSASSLGRGISNSESLGPCPREKEAVTVAQLLAGKTAAFVALACSSLCPGWVLLIVPHRYGIQSDSVLQLAL